MYVNERIWDMTDVIKSINIEDPNFASISNNIYQFNQKRFRIKNWFNLLYESNIKEQKSYAFTCRNIVVENENTFFNKLPEINYLALEYDVIIFESPIMSTIQDFLKIPTFIYDEKEKKQFHEKTIVNLTEFTIPTNEKKEVYSSTPIVYLAGGKLGDFIQSLSVINEKFYETGRKGLLYIYNTGDYFANGLDNTYNDIYPIIINQHYIQDFKIYNYEQFDINLAFWRKDPNTYQRSWYQTYKQTYNVEWGKRRWLNIPIEDEYKNKIVVNTTSNKWPSNFNFNLLKDLYSEDDLLFIASHKNAHDFFEKTANIKIRYHEFTSFLELCTIINSCKLFVGALSAPLTIAHALHKDRICCINPDSFYDIMMNTGLDQIIPNMRYSL